MPSPFKQNFFMSGSPVERQPFSSTNRMNRQYFSKHRYKGASEQLVDEYQLFSPLAIIWVFMFLLAPISYFYIGMVVLRELFGEYLLVFGQNYVPLLHQWTLASAISNLRPPKMPHDLIIGDSFSAAADGFLDSTGSGSSFTIPNVLESTSTMERNPRTWLWLWIEVWCSFEALFFILMRIRIRWLRNVDPLEASLSAAPLMDLSEREYLWRRMQEVEDGNVSEFLSGWFFDHDCQDISAYDVRDFVCWSMFECRHQEHLSEAELLQSKCLLQYERSIWTNMLTFCLCSQWSLSSKSLSGAFLLRCMGRIPIRIVAMTTGMIRRRRTRVNSRFRNGEWGSLNRKNVRIHTDQAILDYCLLVYLPCLLYELLRISVSIPRR